MSTAANSPNPFIKYRTRLDSYRAVASGGLTDARFVEIVERLDEAVAEVDGRGFVVTPLHDGSKLAAAASLDLGLVIKDETGNVAGSHKGRHLMGVALHLLVAEVSGQTLSNRLAIASCGNAALAAGVIARAMGRPLEVFVPTWADAGILDRLVELRATVNQCPRREGEAGDPAYLRFREAVADGATPFSVQATDTPTAFDGGRTLGWELADQAGPLDSIYVQVGGGALATAVSMALPEVRLHPVQAEGCAPLRRAWDKLGSALDIDAAVTSPQEYMWPWPDPQSAADGILDDITYDWVQLLRRTIATGGEPVVAPEYLILQANQLGLEHTDIPVSPTGSAGLAGLLAATTQNGATRPKEKVAVLFTGVSR